MFAHAVHIELCYSTNSSNVRFGDFEGVLYDVQLNLLLIYLTIYNGVNNKYKFSLCKLVLQCLPVLCSHTMFKAIIACRLHISERSCSFISDTNCGRFGCVTKSRSPCGAHGTARIIRCT